jgi:Bacterial proteasome activator
MITERIRREKVGDLFALASVIGLTQMEEALKPDVVEAQPDGDEPEREVTEPTKLIRIASMTRAMLDEARQAPLDEGGRRRMAMVHARSVEELREVLSPELQEEFSEIMVPLNNEEASESELRVAQAQLIGWLEGVFHGIQASLWSQQMTAQTQLAEMQRRALGAPPDQKKDDASGLYL